MGAEATNTVVTHDFTTFPPMPKRFLALLIFLAIRLRTVTGYFLLLRAKYDCAARTCAADFLPLMVPSALRKTNGYL